MPIYEYQAAGHDACDHCVNGFDVMQKLSDEPVTLCPECHNPVKRKISAPNLASPAPSLSNENIETTKINYSNNSITTRKYHFQSCFFSRNT